MNRVLVLVDKQFEGKVPAFDESKLTKDDKEVCKRSLRVIRSLGELALVERRHFAFELLEIGRAHV